MPFYPVDPAYLAGPRHKYRPEDRGHVAKLCSLRRGEDGPQMKKLNHDRTIGGGRL